MAAQFDRIIGELNSLMTDLNSKGKILFKNLKDATLIDNSNALSKVTASKAPISSELQDLIAAFITQDKYTDYTSTFLKGLITPNQPAKPEDLEAATNLVQIYFQVTNLLDQTLSNLVDNLLPDSDLSGSITSTTIQDSIKIIKDNREKLQEAQAKALEESRGILGKLNLKKLVQRSESIKTEFKNLSIVFTPTQPSSGDFSDAVELLRKHLENAGKFFEDFSKNNGNSTGDEPNQIKTLISDWGESVALIEKIEQADSIRAYLVDPSNSRLAIAQSIKIHDLLETNYDYLTALVRSIDLVSAGSL
jgi:hypothetical protein